MWSEISNYYTWGNYNNSYYSNHHRNYWSYNNYRNYWSETTAATKATTKSTKPSSKKKTTKPTSKKVTSSAKKVVKKSPTKAPAKKPSKGYAIVKWKYIITSNDHDKDGNNIKRTFYGEFKCYTEEYGAKSSKKYHMCNTSEGKAFVKKCDPNYRNYTKTPVKIIKFLN